MSQHHPEPEETILSIDAVFTLDFRRDEEKGGYEAHCRELPQMLAWGKTLPEARNDARREIKFALEELAESGQPTPPLTYSPPWIRNPRWRATTENRAKRYVRRLEASFGRK